MSTTIRKIIDYIPKEDREDLNPTKFKFKQLLVSDIKELQNLSAGIEDNQEGIIDLVNKYLVGWENVLNEDGTQLIYSKELLNKMPIAFIGYIVECMLDAMKDSKSQFKKK